MKKHLHRLGQILYNVVLLIGCIIVIAFGLYLSVNEATAKYKLYKYINTLPEERTE